MCDFSNILVVHFAPKTNSWNSRSPVSISESPPIPKSLSIGREGLEPPHRPMQLVQRPLWIGAPDNREVD